jgi:hypothetical protein
MEEISLDGNSRDKADRHSKIIAKGVWQSLGSNPISDAANTDVAITT